MPKMQCHPAKTWLFSSFFLKKKKIHNLRIQFPLTGVGFHLTTAVSPHRHPLNVHSTQLTNSQTYFRNFFRRLLPVACSSEAAALLCSDSLRRLMVESLSTHWPISISKAGTDSSPSGRENCIYILMSTQLCTCMYIPNCYTALAYEGRGIVLNYTTAGPVPIQM